MATSYKAVLDNYQKYVNILIAGVEETFHKNNYIVKTKYFVYTVMKP